MVFLKLLRAAAWLPLAMVVLLLINGCWFTVGTDSLTVVTWLGRPERIAEPGSLYWKWPLIERTHSFTMINQHADADDNVPTGVSNDGFVFHFAFAVYWRESRDRLFSRLQRENAPEVVLEQQARTLFKNAMARLTMEQILGNREDIAEQVRARMTIEAALNDVDLIDVLLTNISPQQPYIDMVAAREVGQARSEAVAAMAGAIHADPEHLALLGAISQWDGKGLTTLVLPGAAANVAVPAGPAAKAN